MGIEHCFGSVFRLVLLYAFDVSNQHEYGKDCRKSCKILGYVTLLTNFSFKTRTKNITSAVHNLHTMTFVHHAPNTTFNFVSTQSVLVSGSESRHADGSLDPRRA